MPRAIDPSLAGGGLPLTHDPLHTIDYRAIPTDFNLGDLLEEIINNAADQVRDYLFPAIKELTGIDLSVLLPLLDVLELDFSTPELFLQSVVNSIMALPAAIAQVTVGVINQLLDPATGTEQMTALLGGLMTVLVSLPSMLIQLGQSLLSSGAGLLGIQSPLNSLNLFNLIPTDILSHIPMSNIGDWVTNMLTDPHFLDEALDDIEDWIHDLVGGFGGAIGSMSTIANGTLKELFGNVIPVSAGQIVPISGKVKWAGLLGTGSPIGLGITGYNKAGGTVTEATVASHNTTPPTTDWVTLSGSYTVPAGVDSIRTRLIVMPQATAGTVSFSDLSATKTGAMLQNLIRGTDAGTLLPQDIENLFTGIISNTLQIIQKASQGDFQGLVNTIAGDIQEGFEDVGERLNAFLHGGSALNGSNITSGNVADQFVSGITTTIDNIVKGLLNIGGSGFGHTDALSAFQSNTHALTDHGAGITNMFGRLSQLESIVAALPVTAGGTGSGNADGGLVGANDYDSFERVSSSNIGSGWLVTQVGAGTWATPNGHDATWLKSGTGTTDFLCIRDAPGIPRSQTDYQRVTLELSSKAAWAKDQILGLFNHAGENHLWLRISDASTSLANITGIRIGWGGDGSLTIVRFVSGAPTVLASLGEGGIVPPGPGANLVGEAGVLADHSPRTFRAMIGTSVRLAITETGTASGLGATNRRWGHGGRAEGHVIGDLLRPSGQEGPGGLHYFAAQDQILT